MQDAPHIGIASVWWEGNPCNMHLLELAKTVKESVKKQGFLAWQYNTIGVSDGITMGSEGRFSFRFPKIRETKKAKFHSPPKNIGMRFSLQSREIIADSIETVTCAQHHDACIAIPGCAILSFPWLTIAFF